MVKKRLTAMMLGLALFAGTALGASAEQLTTVAVFDMDKVLLNFFSESDVLRDYRRAEDQYQADLLIAENDLRDLQAQRATAISRNDSRTAARLRENVQAQQEYIAALKERWYQTRDELLAELQDDRFYETVNQVAGYVAEENGYTLILDVSQTGLNIFWYSQAIDVTEDIVNELLVRF